MKKSRFTDSQIMAALKRVEAGLPVPDICWELGISTATFYKWRAKFGGMDTSMMAELMGSMKGEAVVSVNDIPELRKAFKGHTIKRVSISYTVRASGRDQEPKGELLITNFKPKN